MNDIVIYQQKNCTEKLLKHPSYKGAKGRNDPSRNDKQRGRNVRLGHLHFFIRGRPKRHIQPAPSGFFRAKPARIRRNKSFGFHEKPNGQQIGGGKNLPPPHAPNLTERFD
jgi:hypothetical protein